MGNEFVDALKELVDRFVKGEITDAQMKKGIEGEIKKLIEGGARRE